jgi:hypothetical protein
MMFEGLNLEASAGDALISVRVNSILENIILWGQFASALRKGGSLISWWDLVLGCWWARQGWIHFRLVVRWSVAADSLISFSGCWFASSAGLHAALLLCSSGGDGWCALESIYSAWSPGSKSSFGGGVSTMWTLSVQHMVATSSTPVAGQRWREDPESGVCNFQISPVIR